MPKSGTSQIVGRGHDSRGWQSVVIVVVSLIFSGCSLLPEYLLRRSPDQDLFLQGVDALAATPSPAAFSRLAREFPDSPWTARAKSIEKIQKQLRESQRERQQLQQRIDEIRAERDRLAGDLRAREVIQKELDACLVEKKRLSGEVRSLEEYTRRLRSVLAESGIAEPVSPGR